MTAATPTYSSLGHVMGRSGWDLFNVSLVDNGQHQALASVLTPCP